MVAGSVPVGEKSPMLRLARAAEELRLPLERRHRAVRWL